MPVTPVTIPDLPTASTVELVAELIEQRAHITSPDTPRLARALARDILALLVGDDDNPGPLDRYQIAAEVVLASGKPLVTWYCPDNHAESGAGHLGIIARDFDGDQTGLTLGEIAAAALAHEEDEHR